MDAIFRQMLGQAEIVRGNIDYNRFIGPHALQLRKIRKYAEEHRLFRGDLQNKTANVALLNYHAEIAACRLEIIKGKTVGSILSLSKNEKLDLIKQASLIY